MSAQIVPFVFKENLVRTVEADGEPWFVGRDVCKVLSLANESQAMSRLEVDERRDGVTITDPIGREQSVIVISEPGVYRLVFASRKAEAEEFKRWLAHEVLPQIRKTGKFAPPEPDRLAFVGDDRAVAQLNAQLAVVKEARLLFGAAKAAALWSVMGLPDPAASRAPSVAGDPVKCLKHLLALEGPGAPPLARTIGRDILDVLTMDFENAIETGLATAGVRIERDEPEGVVIANSHPWLLQFLDGTPWADGRYCLALKRLPGARAVGPSRFAGRTCRGVFLPIDLVLGAIPPDA